MSAAAASAPGVRAGRAQVTLALAGSRSERPIKRNGLRANGGRFRAVEGAGSVNLDMPARSRQARLLASVHSHGMEVAPIDPNPACDVGAAYADEFARTLPGVVLMVTVPVGAATAIAPVGNGVGRPAISVGPTP